MQAVHRLYLIYMTKCKRLSGLVLLPQEDNKDIMFFPPDISNHRINMQKRELKLIQMKTKSEPPAVSFKPKDINMLL